MIGAQNEAVQATEAIMEAELRAPEGPGARGSSRTRTQLSLPSVREDRKLRAGSLPPSPRLGRALASSMAPQALGTALLGSP